MSDAPGPHPSVPGTSSGDPAPYLALGPRVGLRPFAQGDADEFTARARESRELHRPWLFPPCTPGAYAAYAGTLLGDPARTGFLVCERAEGGRIAGFVNINNIVRGAFRSGTLGYGAFAHAAGRGLLTEALGLVLEHAFGPLDLHRLEANIQPGNAASRALVRRAGFRLEGFSPAMLFIDGAWRDHERWAITAPATAPEPAARTRDGLSACG
ncbi:GNAT family N-acetyltransferase [Streptomyces sp. WAC08241]|uniref:GNAT family N-acetyltransferase n=1 Tax=Streptomyces sp. WAC08241 TaxID=2487421 RepID=UPI000F7A9BDE|nr:GNAT family protein [Streptomyces sp. WAC08241]RSS40535.1 N-acetyltransferase [Streptomyces sp. WAC08241]